MLWATTLVCLVLVSLYVKADYGCSEDLTQTDKTRKIFLDFHNDVRRNISTGIQPNRPVYSRFLGPAKNMYKLKWDCDLEKKAQYQVSSCTFKVPPGMCRLSMSQNSISVNYVNGKEEEALRFAQKNWMNPVTTYGVPPNRKFFYRLETFANIANHKNMKLGCAYKVCGSEMLVACIYGTKRIPPMQELWENGRTCECDAHPDSFCSNGICETNMVMKPETKTSTKKPRPPVEGPDSCKANTGMTDDLREIFLKKHNYYRSFVAKGLAKDKFGGYAPKAARMLKMVYDCEIEANRKLAAPIMRECTMSEPIRHSKPTDSAVLACDKFFAELKDHGVGQDNILTNELFIDSKRADWYILRLDGLAE
ncbi:SCP-like protein [Ostertagia ostertagi]